MATKLAASSRVRSAFAVADQHALLAASHHREDELGPCASSSWSRPALLKLPSASRSEHWAATSADPALYYSPSCTPQVETFRSLQTQFSHPERTPQIQVVRSEQDGFRFPLSTPQVRVSRLREEGTFRAPPNTPQLAALRSAEGSFKSSPGSAQAQLLRQSFEDPFRNMSPEHTGAGAGAGAGAGQGLKTAMTHSPQAILAVRQQIESFRSEPLTPTLVAIRERLESFVLDRTEVDPLAAAIAQEAEDPFAKDPSFSLQPCS